MMMSSELLPAFVHFTEYNISGPETNNDNDEMEVLSFEDMMMQAVTPSILKAPSTDNVKITPVKTGADHYSNNRTTRTPSMDTSSYVPTYSKPAAIDTKSWKSTTSAASSSCSWTPKSQAGSANINNRNNLPTLSQTPFTPASLSAVHILNSTKDIASKVTGKRPPPSSFLNDFDFPPVSMSNATTTTPSNHSSHKKHQSNNSYSRAPSTTNTSTTTPMTSTTSCYYNCSSTVSQVENVLFAPQQMTRQAFEERSHQWHYFSCDLQLEEIITQIDHQLEQIATESNEDDHHNQTLQSLYQQLYLYYLPFQYSWMIFQCQSIEQCELKIQVFRIRDDQLDGDYSGHNDQYDLSGVQLFLPQHYMITFEHIGGSQALFKSLFEKVKLAIGTYDDCWTKDLTVNVQSKCVLMSPTDYYYYQHHGKADPSGCSNTTTPNTSEKCRGEVSKKMNTSASEMLTMLTHAEFYADPTNITHLDEWISQILQYETKLEQYEAIRHLCQLCHAAHEEKKFLLLLEQLGLIEALMTVFIPAPTDTTALTAAASAVVSSEPVFGPIIADNDEVMMNDLYSIKPYVIQMLLYFTQREQPVRKMLNDKHFIAFLTSVVTNHNPQLSSFDASSATMSLKWMKLYRDCQRLSEELCKMIQTDDEVAEYDDGMMFSPKNNNNSHSHHHNGSNHQLKSKC